MTKVLKRLNIVKAEKMDINRGEIRFDFLSGGIDVNQYPLEKEEEDAIKLSCFSSFDKYEFFKPIQHDQEAVMKMNQNSPEYKEALDNRKKYLAAEKSKILNEVADAVNKFEKDIVARMKRLGYKFGK